MFGWIVPLRVCQSTHHKLPSVNALNMFCSTSKYEGERMKESLPEVGDLHLSSGAADASLHHKDLLKQTSLNQTAWLTFMQ